MKTTDFNAKVTADMLNESMFKKFGTRINFDKYTREDLENYRNLLRTKVSHMESSSKFNDLLANEGYQKDKFMLNLINTKISEMLGEGVERLDEKSKSEKQARMMAAAAHDPKFAKKVGVKQGVAKEFNKADKGTKLLSKAMKHKNMDENSFESSGKCTCKTEGKDNCAVHGKMEENMKTGDSKKSSTGGTITKTKTGVVHKAGTNYSGKTAEKEEKKVKEASQKTPSTWTDKSGKTHSATKVKGDKYTGKEAEKEEKKVKEASEKTPTTWTDKSGKKHSATKVKGSNYTGKEAEKEEKTKKVKESIRRAHYTIIIEGLQRFIAEDEEGKAKDITAGTDMVNDFTSWMQRIGQYQTKSMIELADSIRANFGQAEADAFKQAIQPALSEALAALTQSRETITRAVAVLAGEESAQQPMGMDGMGDLGGADDLGGELPASGPDTMNGMGDEFGASDAAAGGGELSGREMRESRQMSKLQKIAESHSIISKLAK